MLTELCAARVAIPAQHGSLSRSWPRDRSTSSGSSAAHRRRVGDTRAYTKYPRPGVTVEIAFTGAHLAAALVAVSDRAYVTVAQAGSFDPDRARKSRF